MQDLKGKGPQEFLHPLDIARQKYFFHDDSTPTFRIQEDVDDCGNEITEPELWRPSWMDSEAYNAKIEVILFHNQLMLFSLVRYLALQNHPFKLFSFCQNAKRKWTLSTSTQVIKGYSSQVNLVLMRKLYKQNIFL